MNKSSPFEQEEVDVVVFLGEEVAEDASWISGADLVGGQSKVDTLHKVPELGRDVVREAPKKKWKRCII